MFACGIEEPAKPNEQVYLIDDLSGSILLDNTDDKRLNRYSFVWLGEWQEFDSVTWSLASEISNQLDTPATAVVALPDWKDARSIVRKRSILKTLGRDGWHLESLDEMVVAFKAVAGSNSAANTTSTMSLLRQKRLGILITYCETSNIDLLMQQSFSASLSHMSKFQRFIPSKHLLRDIASLGMGIMYQSRDMLGRNAAVVVGAKTIDASNLENAKAFFGDSHGERAEKVWMIPPSG